jgi:serine/threonine-protein kinase
VIGTTLSHYRIVDKLGEGGMGAVYRGEDTRLGREVAIKVLPAAFTADPERLARFEREARVLASLNHPNIAAIHDLETEGDTQFLVMELAEGETLQQRIARGPIPVEQAARIALQIAEALEAAHDKGIVHRDLKPANISLATREGSGSGPGGSVKVLDFGLAKALEGEAAGGAIDLTQSPTLTQQMTRAGVLLGTAAYMSPEQARGQTADRRADIWAFGVVLMEMLSGRGIFSGDTVSDTLAGVLAREPAWTDLPEATPRSIRDLLERCLEKDMRHRLQAIGEARIALERYLADPRAESVAGSGVTAGVEPEPSRWKRALPWGVAALLALAAAWALLRPAAPPEPRPRLRLTTQLSPKPLFADLGASIVLSPEGQRLAYVTGDSGSMTLHLKALDSLHSAELASGSSGPDGPYNPFFSPDGEWLGFVTADEMRKVPVSGGTPITLTRVNRSRGASWAPDGSIVYAPDPSSALMRIADSGGDPEPLTTLDAAAGEATHRWPEVLPNGKGVLFTSYSSPLGNFDGAQVEVLELATGERKVLRRGGYYGRYSPSGHLLYVNSRTIFAVPFDAETLELAGSPAPVVQEIAANPSDGGAQFSVSPDGMLAYAGGTGMTVSHPIAWIDRSGRTSTLLAERGAYALPSLSPDGRLLALSVQRDQNWDVWVYDLERGASTRLTFDEAYDADQVWSPDGRFLVFTSDRGGNDDLYRKRADGSGEEERLTEGKTLYPSDWSLDGRWLVGVTSGQGNDLWILDLEHGGEPEPLVATPYSESYAAFSPDSRWIAYSSNESGRLEVYVRPLPPAAGRWQVSTGGGGEPRWSRDGAELYYRADDGLMAVPVSADGESFRAGTPQLLFRADFRGSPSGLSFGGFTFRSWEVAPEGRFIVFPESADESRGSEIVLVTDWFEDLRRVFE